MTDVVPAGESYAIIWRRKFSYNNTAFADIVIEESSDLTNWTTNPVVPSTDDKVNFISTTLTASVNTRYIRIRTLTGSNDDIDFDAVEYKFCNDPNCASGNVDQVISGVGNGSNVFLGAPDGLSLIHI